MKNDRQMKRLDQRAVNAVASFARGVAQNSVDAACTVFIYQPKEPKGLAQRLQEMKEK